MNTQNTNTMSHSATDSVRPGRPGHQRMTTHLPRASTIVICLAVVVAAHSIGHAEQLKSDSVVVKKNPRTTVEYVLDAQALRVVRDSETGELRAPTAEEIGRFGGDAQEKNRSTEGLKRVKHENGTESVNLEGRFLNTISIHKHDDGTVAVGCDNAAADDAKEAVPNE